MPKEIVFECTKIEMGELKLEQPESVNFIFQNTGNTPQIIQHVETGCGCAALEWPKQPIKPD